MSRKHSTVPLKHTATGMGYNLQSTARGLRAEFEELQRATRRHKQGVYDVVLAMALRLRNEGMPPTQDELDQLVELTRP